MKRAFCRALKTTFTVPGCGLLVAFVAGCSWDRFEQLRSDAPLEEMKSPTATENFGVAVAATFDRTRAFALGLGGPGDGPGASYLLGRDEEPTLETERADFCLSAPPERLCAAAARPAGLSTMTTSGGDRRSCFVTGSGLYRDSAGLLGLCADGTISVFDVPEDLLDALVTPLVAAERTEELFLAADRSEAPYLVAGVPGRARAFYYPPGSREPADLTPNGDPPESFGRNVEVLRSGERTLFVVAAPEARRLWFFGEEAGTLEVLGCADGGERFGRALASGDVDGDGFADLAVSDGDGVAVYSGATLFSLAATAADSCEIPLADEGTELARLRCQTSEPVEGCSGSDFGAALAVFDGAGDGSAEIAIGAPRARVRSVEEAGAVYVFSGTGRLLDVNYRGEGLAEGRFGASLAPVVQERRDVLVVGEPGASKVSVLYCAGVTREGVSSRCDARVSP